MTLEKFLMITVGILIIVAHRYIYLLQVWWGKQVGWELEYSEWWYRIVGIFIGLLFIFIGVIK